MRDMCLRPERRRFRDKETVMRVFGTLGAHKRDGTADTVTTRTGRRYAWARLQTVDGRMLELTLWADGRYTLQARGSRGSLEVISEGTVIDTAD